MASNNADNQADEMMEIENIIAEVKGEKKKLRSNTFFFISAFFICLVTATIFISSPLFKNYHLITTLFSGFLSLSITNSIDDHFVQFSAISMIIASFVCIAGFAHELIDYNNLSAEIDKPQSKKEIMKLFDKNNEKPSYFDSLVRINVENLESYYRLVKAQTDNSFKIVIGVSILGFILIGIGIVAGFVNFNHFNMVTYISASAGIIAEAISSIFFAFHSKTIQQMKEYHKNIIEVQNILLSFKIIEGLQEEKDKAQIISQLVGYLTNKKTT